MPCGKKKTTRLIRLCFVEGIYDEVKQMRDVCASAHMKAILAVGELGSLRNIYKASMVCMMAGKFLLWSQCLAGQFRPCLLFFHLFA